MAKWWNKLITKNQSGFIPGDSGRLWIRCISHGNPRNFSFYNLQYKVTTRCTFSCNYKRVLESLCQTSINDGKVRNDHFVYFMAVLDILSHYSIKKHSQTEFKRFCPRKKFTTFSSAIRCRRVMNVNWKSYLQTLLTSFNYFLTGGGPI